MYKYLSIKKKKKIQINKMWVEKRLELIQVDNVLIKKKKKKC